MNSSELLTKQFQLDFNDRGIFSYMTLATVVELNLEHLATLEKTAKYNDKANTPDWSRDKPLNKI